MADVTAKLAEALRRMIDLAWETDSHRVQFDSTVMFGQGYDFSGVDGPSRQEFLGAVECVVWPSGGIGHRKWSAYCTHDGSMWFERFDSAEAAKEACMRLLDAVLPDHPAMQAREALAAYEQAQAATPAPEPAQAQQAHWTPEQVLRTQEIAADLKAKIKHKPLTEQEVAEAVFDYYQHFSDPQYAAEACFDKDLAMFRLAERACAEAWGVTLAGIGASTGGGNG